MITFPKAKIQPADLTSPIPKSWKLKTPRCGKLKPCDLFVDGECQYECKKARGW